MRFKYLIDVLSPLQAMTAQQQKNLAMVNQRVQSVNNINPVNISQLSAAAQAAALRARGGRPQPLTPATPTSVLRSAANPAMRTSMSPGGMVIPNNFQLSAAAIAAAANKFVPVNSQCISLLCLCSCLFFDLVFKIILPQRW